MRIFLGLVLLIFSSTNLYSAEKEVYCTYPESFLPYYVKKTNVPNNEKAKFYCKEQKGISISKEIFDRLDVEDKNWTIKSHEPDPVDNSWFIKKTLRHNEEFMQKRADALEKIYNEYASEIKIFNQAMENEIKIIEREKADNARIEAEKQRQLKTQLKNAELEKLYSDVCGRTNKKGSDKYNNCLLEKDSKDLAVRKKSEIEAKIVAEKLSKMTPDDRRAYTCSEKFGFRKGSDKFKDCLFKIYSAEIELEKLELQKQLAKANADLARANSDRQDRLALAQTETARMQAYAAQQQAISANTADSLALIESGLRMMSPQRPAAAPMRTCTYTGRFMNCF